jgi:hypothetical protein
MAKIINFGNSPAPQGLGVLEREQLAAQIVAIMQAHFTRPGPEEMKEILHSATEQVTALQTGQVPLS